MNAFGISIYIHVVVQLLSPVWLFVTPWTAAYQASLSTISQSLYKLVSLESVMLSNHLILCHCLLLLPSVFPSIRFFFFFPQIKMGAFHQPIFSIFGAALRGCGILVPQQESSPHPLYWKGRVLTTGAPDKSSNVFFLRDEQSVKAGAPHPGF